jgi:hypothetical protein
MGNLNHSFYENYELVEILRGLFVTVFNKVSDSGVHVLKFLDTLWIAKFLYKHEPIIFPHIGH